MKSNLDYRTEAWRLLFGRGWFWKLIAGAILLSLCGQAVNVVISGILGRMEIMDLSAFQRALVEAKASGSALPQLAHGQLAYHLVTSSLLEGFFAIIMGGIAAYGYDVLRSRCLRDDDTDWLKACFGGFRIPLDLAWLFLRLMLIFLGWTLLGLLPFLALAECFAPSVSLHGGLASAVVLAAAISLGLLVLLLLISIPFYRYRFLFLVKAEHPELSAGDCLRRARALTDGHKMASFRLDCSYWRPITLVLLIGVLFLACFGAAVALKSVSVAACALCVVVGLLVFLAYIPAAIVLAQYISVGQGLFYRDLAEQLPLPAAETPATGD